MQSRELMVYGAGDHGLVVAEAAAADGWRVLGFVDDGVPAGRRAGVWSVLGGAGILSQHESVRVIVAVGDNATRQRLLENIPKTRRLALAHPDASVSPSARLQAGAFVAPCAVVHAEAFVDEGAIVNSGAVVEHHNRIGRAAHVAPGAVLCGRVSVGDRALIGAGAVILPGVTVGPGAVIGAGAVVRSDVPEGRKAWGVPAVITSA